MNTLTFQKLRVICMIVVCIGAIPLGAMANHDDTGGFPAGPFGSSFTHDTPSTYEKFLSYEALVQKLTKVANKSQGVVTLQSVNQFVNGVCDIGEPCRATFDNVHGPFDLRSFLGRDLLLAIVGSGPKKILFITGQHGTEDEPSTRAALQLLKTLSKNGHFAQQVRQEITLYIMVRANPDGAEIIDRDDGLPPHPRRCNATPFDRATGSPSSCHVDLAGAVRLGNDPNRWHFVDNIDEKGVPITNAEIYARAPATLAFIQLYKTIRGVPHVNQELSPTNTYANGEEIAYLADWHGNFAKVSCALVFDVIKQEFVCAPGEDATLVTVEMRANAGAVLGMPPTVPRGSAMPVKVIDPALDNLNKQIVVNVTQAIEPFDHIKVAKYAQTNIDGGGYGRASTSYAYEGTPSMLYEVLWLRHDFNDSMGDKHIKPATNISYTGMIATLRILATESFQDIADPQQAYADDIAESTGLVGANLRLPPYSASPTSFLENFLGMRIGNAEIVPNECACPFSASLVRDASLVTGPEAFRRCIQLQMDDPAEAPRAASPFPFVGFPPTLANCPDPS